MGADLRHYNCIFRRWNAGSQVLIDRYYPITWIKSIWKIESRVMLRLPGSRVLAPILAAAAAVRDARMLGRYADRVIHRASALWAQPGGRPLLADGPSERPGLATQGAIHLVQGFRHIKHVAVRRATTLGLPPILPLQWCRSVMQTSSCVSAVRCHQSFSWSW